MLITIDVGNTNIVIGLLEKKKLVERYRVRTDLKKTSDEYGLEFRSLLSFSGLSPEAVTGAIISSVVPPLDQSLALMLDKYFHVKPLFVGPGMKSGIAIRIPNPKELGADILVGIVAAGEKHGFPVITIDMGTAITFAYADRDRALYGGVVMAGIRTSLSSLISRTSKLEAVSFNAPEKVVNGDTASALQSGAVYGMASMIDGMIRRIKRERGEAPVVITGGEALIVLPYLEEKVIHDDDLLTEGLALLYEKNAPSES